MKRLLVSLLMISTSAGCGGGDEEPKWVCSCRVDCPTEPGVIEDSRYDFCGAEDAADAANKGKTQCENSLGAICNGEHTCSCICEESGEMCGG